MHVWEREKERGHLSYNRLKELIFNILIKVIYAMLSSVSGNVMGMVCSHAGIMISFISLFSTHWPH